jgi:charged multivesicular body protein 4
MPIFRRCLTLIFSILKDELEAELEDLEEEELDHELPEPPQSTRMEPSARVTTSSQPANDLAELTKLQAEMAL